ncbi:hypothetical protein ABPG77_000747 [Micractinium sp. CCAP 211/92]
MSQLPEDTLLLIFSLLSARDLAALAVQDTYLRRVASDPSLWQPLAQARWPGAEAAAEGLHLGDWHALFLARTRMPVAFPMAADRVHAVTGVQQARAQRQQQGGKGGAAAAVADMPAVSFTGQVPGGALPALAFEDVMRQVFSVGMACSTDRSVRRSREWSRLKHDLGWWAAEQPTAVVAFVREAHELLAGAGARCWADAPWRRSAVAFLQDLGLLMGVHASVVSRVQAEAAALDRAMHSVRQELGATARGGPAGAPDSHWGSDGRSARTGRRCAAGPTVGLLLVAVLALSWVWDGSRGPKSRPATPLRSPEVAADAAHAEAVAGDVSRAVRPQAAARMAARARRRTVDALPAGNDAHALRLDDTAAGKHGSSSFAAAAGQAGVPSNASSSTTAAAAAAAEAAVASSRVDPEECQPSLVVVLTSHKTGTAQAGCITEMLEQRYVMQGAARHDHHPASLHAISAFAAERLQTEFTGGGGLGRLYCPTVKFYSTGHHLPRLEDERCPGTLPCPCQGGRELCLATEGGSIDIPRGNTTVVQVFRSPVNVVLSAYQYHTLDPVPEEWLQNMSMENFTGWMHSGGVPYEALDSLGAYASRPSESYYSFLRRLPEEKGVKLQFWMSAWELYGFARQAASLEAQARQPGLRLLTLRFEDLQSRYNETVRVMLEAFKERLPQLAVDPLLDEVQACHISSWARARPSPAVLPDGGEEDRGDWDWQHITSSKNPELRARLRGVLFSDPEIAPRLCQLSAIFGYASEPECVAQAWATADGAAAGANNSSSHGQ